MSKELLRKSADVLIHAPAEIARRCGKDKLIPSLHGKWIEKMITSKEDMTLLAHRGSYKTTCLAFAMAAMAVLYPDKNMIFLRKTDDDVTEVLREVKGILSSPVMQEIARNIYGCKMDVVKSDRNSVQTSLYCSGRGAMEIVGQGINGSLTGKHADIVITDDIVNVSDRTSAAEREHTCQVYMELQNIKVVGGRIINCGTPWHKNDAISLMPGVMRYSCYDTGLLKKEDIAHLRRSMSATLFAANYELRHVAAEDALFDSPRPCGVPGELLAGGIAHIDAAYGGEDSTVLTLANMIDDKIILLGKKRHGHVEKHLEEFLGICEENCCTTLHLETNGDKGYLARSIREMGRCGETDVAVRCYHESMNKVLKISTYLKGAWENVEFAEGTDSDYITDIMDWTENAPHDDCPDSASSAVRVLGRRLR